MSHRLYSGLLLASSVVLSASAPSLAAQAADPDPARFADDFAEFARWDAENFVPENGVLFIGSSSINFWRTAEAFPDLPVINRGFGGSQASDVVHWVDEGVLKYDPAVVVYYEGDNDISGGKDADQVMEDFREFVHALRSAGSEAEILFLSIKPSPARMESRPEMQRANARLESFTESHAGLHFVDVGSDLLDSAGRPVPEYFRPDGIHLTAAGYEIWNEIVGQALGRILH